MDRRILHVRRSALTRYIQADLEIFIRYMYVLKSDCESIDNGKKFLPSVFQVLSPRVFRCKKLESMFRLPRPLQIAFPEIKKMKKKEIRRKGI